MGPHVDVRVVTDSGCFRSPRHCLMQIPVCLQTHPELRRGLQETSETQGGVGGNATLAQHDLVQAVQGNLQPARGLHLAQFEWLEKFLDQHLSWGNSWSKP